jgi:putative acetyltransferase
MAERLALTIRPETSADHAAIHDLTRRAFAPMPYAGGDEQDLIDKLRDAGALAISLVAEHEGSIVGHIAFSPAYSADTMPGWFALGPVSAEPALKHRGIGSALIEHGIALLGQRDAAGCVLTGNPAYYRRFGFLPFPALCPEGQPKQFFQILPLRIAQPDSVISFHPLFSS